MSNKTTWADLPNSKYIDIILDLLKKDFAAWDAARDAAWDAVWNASRDTARDTARDAARDAIWNTARDVSWAEAWAAVMNAPSDIVVVALSDAVRALIAWDDCGYLLDEKPEDVKMLALLGNQAAIMLYPACFALNKSKELEKV